MKFLSLLLHNVFRNRRRKPAPRRMAGKALSLILGACLAAGAGPPSIAQVQTNLATDPATQAGATEGLTLPLAVDIALRTNPLARATASERELADARLREARASRFPVLQFGENFARSNNPVFVFGSLLEQGRFGPENFALRSLNNPDPLDNYRTALTFRMPIFDQRQTSTRITQATVQQQEAEARRDQVQQQIRFEALRAFYGVLLAQAKKEVADEAVKLAEADVKLSADRVEAGTAVTSDLLAAEVQLAEFRQQQIQSKGDITIAVAALNTALGLPVDTPQKVNGALIEKTFDVTNQAELVRLALRHRSDYSRAGLSLREREEQLKGARGEFLPRLEVLTSFGVSGRTLASGSSDYLVGASLTFNLFDAGRSAKIDQARAAANLAASEQQHVAQQIALDVVRAYQQYLSARERLNVAPRVSNHAAEALRIVQDRYYEGLTTITEVLRAETALMRARLNVLAVRYEYYVGYANVLLTSGTFTDVQPFVS